MKHKITIVILPILVIISLALNIYQYQTLNTLKSQYTTLQSSIDDLTTEKQSLDSAVSDKDAEIATLTATIDDLQSQIKTLQAENDDLSSQIDDLQATIKEQEESAYLADTLPDQQQTSTASSTSSQQSSNSSSSSGGTTTVDNSIPGMVDIGTISFGGQATAEGSTNGASAGIEFY